MYCPKCGIDNIPRANFCRACGVSLQRASTSSTLTPLSNSAQPDLGRALKKLFVGIAFLIIAFVPLIEGEPILWWLLFPGIPMVIKGIRLLAQMGQAGCFVSDHRAALASNQTQPISPLTSNNVSVRPTGELIPPPSVTENTTRLLDESSPAVR